VTDTGNRLRIRAAAAPDVWPRLRRTIAAERRVAALIARLEHPPTPWSRAGWALRAELVSRRAA
jgi:hypothetical protein